MQGSRLRSPWWQAWLWVFALVSAMAAGGVRADTVETVLMPGQLIKGHADLEGDCKNCHARFDRKAQDGLCLDCHKDVAKDFSQHLGFHGKQDKKECRACHTEHKGRGFNIAPFDKDKFDHKKTNFELKDSHSKVECKDCHKPGLKFREAHTVCVACHKKDDKHKGSLGDKCENCHTEKKWKDVKFDHSKTNFPLLGKHADVKCKECHADQRYKGAPTACIACHRKDDKHKAHFGDKCETCHTEKDWKTITFDHDKDTHYPLRGKHSLVTCVDCHTGFLYKQKTPTTCVACHRDDDEHKGHFGPKCETCHIEKDWNVVIFDHDKQTKYPLLGKHAEAKCEACHKGDLYKEKLQTVCFACHEKDDKHKGQEGKKCEQCHNEKSWNTTQFDHGLTRFPLLGKHDKVECKKCHLTPEYKNAKTACVECHKKDDKHKRKLGPECEMCHNARDWKAWDYDHDTRTHFKLDGGHKGIDCLACHKEPTDKKVKVTSSCGICHAWDDVHNGSFGKDCERCHVTSSFKKIRIGIGTKP
jgi:hypothetical protein